jgi:hypothetical protein
MYKNLTLQEQENSSTGTGQPNNQPLTDRSGEWLQDNYTDYEVRIETGLNDECICKEKSELCV